MNSNEQLREASTKLLECMKKVVHAAWFIDADFCDADEAKDAIRQMESALALPRRNCDVGTAEEQAKRFKQYCDSKVCKRRFCHCYGYEHLFHHKCFPIWLRMPYEEVKE